MTQLNLIEPHQVPKPTRATASGVRWKVAFCLIAPITFVMALDRTAVTISAPVIQKEYGFSLVEMSYILTAYSWAYAFLQLPSGWLAEKLGPRISLFVANILWSLMTFVTPFATGFASFLGIRTFLGLGQSADWPSSVLAISRWFPSDERGKASSILLGGLYLGTIVAGPFTSFIIVTLGWRVTFYILGFLGLALGFIWLIFFRDYPSDKSGVSQDELELLSASGGKKTLTWSVAVKFFAQRRFWAVGMQYFCLFMIIGFYYTWLPTYLMNEYQISIKSLGFFASLPWVSLFIMCFVTGALGDRILRLTSNRWAARVPMAVAGFAISSAALVWAAYIRDIPLLMTMLCISLGAVGLTMVTVWATVQDLAQGYVGFFSGFTNTCGNIGIALGPVVMAYVVQWTGSWAGAFLAIGGCGVAGIVLWLFIQPQLPLDPVDAVS